MWVVSDKYGTEFPDTKKETRPQSIKAFNSGDPTAPRYSDLKKLGIKCVKVKK